MTDAIGGTGPDSRAGLLLTVLLHIEGADVASLQDYEAAVLPLLPSHGGVLERRLRARDGSLEMHLVRFPDRSAFERYMADGRRLAAAPLLARSRATVTLFQAEDLPPHVETGSPVARMEPLESGATALIVIDVQSGFDDPVWGRRNNPEAEERIAELIAAWRQAAGPVHHVQHASTEPDSPLRPSHPGHAIKPDVLPATGEPIHRKEVNSAFIGTSLEADLRAGGVDTVVLVGLTTNHCVSTTARMAANLGFRTIVVSDATATFDRRALDGQLRPASEVHAAALSDLAGEFAAIASTASVASALRGGGGAGRW